MAESIASLRRVFYLDLRYDIRKNTNTKKDRK